MHCLLFKAITKGTITVMLGDKAVKVKCVPFTDTKFIYFFCWLRQPRWHCLFTFADMCLGIVMLF